MQLFLDGFAITVGRGTISSGLAVAVVRIDYRVLIVVLSLVVLRNPSLSRQLFCCGAGQLLCYGAAGGRIGHGVLRWSG